MLGISVFKTAKPGAAASMQLLALLCVAQCTVFVVSIDWARMLANIMASTLLLLLVAVIRFNLYDVLAGHAERWHRYLLVSAALFLAIPKFGIVTP